MAQILHLISQLEEGGAQRLLSNVVALSKRHQVEIASLIASPPEKLFPFFRDCPVPIHFLSDSLDFYHPAILPALRKLLKENRFGMMQCWLFESITQGVIASRMEGIPCIAFPHNMTSLLQRDHRFWENILVRKVAGLADLTIFPSSSTSINFLHEGIVDRSAIRILRNGVDCSHFRPAMTGDALVAVGRLSSEKGFDFLAKVVRRLRTNFPELRCIVAGSGTGSLSSEFEQVGFREDIREIYKQAAIYISTSWEEGLSIALLEAQAMGIPAVVRRIGPNSEVIEHGVNGFLAQSEGDYAAACARLLENPDLRREMGTRARAAILEQFSIERQVEEMESVQDELL